MSKGLSDVRLIDLLPDSIAHDGDVKAGAEALDKQLLDMTGAVDLPSIYVSIDNLTSAQLDHVAYGWDASVWRDSWPIALKRSILKNVVREKRKKGTRRAVEEAVESIQGAATIQEWWEMEPKGEPHTFTVFATLGKIDGTIDSELQDDLIALINDAKPVRSHFDFVVVKNLLGRFGFHGSLRPVTYGRIRSETREGVEIKGALRVKACVRAFVERALIATCR